MPRAIRAKLHAWKTFQKHIGRAEGSDMNSHGTPDWSSGQVMGEVAG